MSPWGADTWLTLASVVVAAVAVVFTALARRDARRSARDAEALAERMTQAVETIAYTATQRLLHDRAGEQPPPAPDLWTPSPHRPAWPQSPPEPQHSTPPPSPAEPPWGSQASPFPVEPVAPARSDPWGRVTAAGPVAWTVEHHAGDQYVLRNLGTVAVSGVRVEHQSSVDVEEDQADPVLEPFAGHRFTATSRDGHPMPGWLTVSWDGPTPGTAVVPFPSA